MKNKKLNIKYQKHILKYFKIFGFVFFIFGFWFLVLRPVWAQTFSLGIYPPLLEVMIQPGRSITQVYKVKNSGDNLVLVPNVLSFEPEDELGNIFLTRLDPVSKEWFSLINANRSLGQAFSLPSGKTEELVLRIKVPKEASEADHYFSLILTTSPTPPIGRTKMGMKGVIASNILVTISKEGKPRKLAEIAEFSSPKIVDSFDQPVFDVQIRNIGQAFFKPQGNISIYNTIGQHSYNLELLPENVLVHSSRQIRCQESDKVTPCQLEPKFLLGRYLSKLSFDVNGENFQAETVFWALPIKATLALLTMGILLFTMKSRVKQNTKS